MCLDGGIFRGQSDNTRVSGQTLAADGPHQGRLYCPRIPGLSSFPAAVTKGNITRQSMMNAKLRQQRFLHGYENRLLKTIQMIHNLVSSWFPLTVDYGLTLCILILGKGKLIWGCGVSFESSWCVNFHGSFQNLFWLNLAFIIYLRVLTGHNHVSTSVSTVVCFVPGEFWSWVDAGNAAIAQ